jgi:CheY-like chemotaxis protein
MRKSVLVVDDNDGCREVAASVLRLGGYAVTEAADGQEALRSLAGGAAPDVILLDMLMPVLDGWQFLKHLKASAHGTIPVVITTGTILTREWAESFAGAGFLKKPFTDDELLAEVRRCAGRPA